MMDADAQFCREALDVDMEMNDDIPSIVIDIVDYWNHRNKSTPPRSLVEAARTCSKFGELTFNVVCLNLVDWWGGGNMPGLDMLARQKASIDLKPEWTWCQALPQVLASCPELAFLIEVRGLECCFLECINKRTRNNIKRYVRQQREWPRLRT
jgi:hypothetical protein